MKTFIVEPLPQEIPNSTAILSADGVWEAIIKELRAGRSVILKPK